MALEPESVLDGRFRIIDRIGSGGMAHVYRAQDFVSGDEVAVKVLSRRLLESMDEEADRNRRRFRREADCLATLQGSLHVVELVTTRLEGEVWYIVMELVEGASLRSVIDAARKGLDPGRILQIATQVVDGLKAIHGHRILHRDLAPDNIVIVRSGGRPLVKFLDFGIGKPIEETDAVTQMPTIMGKPQYLSPEQTRGEALSASSDVYSLGVVLYELLTGELPIALRSMAEIARVRNEAPVPLARHERSREVPEELRALIMASLQKEPGKRPTLDEYDECLAEIHRRRDHGHDMSAAFSEYELRQLAGETDEMERFRPGVVVAGVELDSRLPSDDRVDSWSAHRPDGTDVLVRALAGDATTTAMRKEALDRARVLDHEGILALRSVEIVEDVVVAVHDAGPRETLADVVERTRGVDSARFLQIATGLVEVLSHGHGQPRPVIHGALSPWCVLLDDFDAVQVVDFGMIRDASEIDRLAPRSVIARWAAPEIITEGVDSPAADVYSLGCVLYHACCGRAPFEGAESAVLYRQAARKPTPPVEVRPTTIPRAVSDLVLLCLAKVPGERPASGEVGDLLNRAFARPGEPLLRHK